MDLQTPTRQSNTKLRERYLREPKTLYSRVKDARTFTETGLLVNKFIPFDESGYVVRNSKFSFGFNLVVIHLIQLLFMVVAIKQPEKRNGIIIGEIILAIFAVYNWVGYFNRKQKLKIDSTGIYIGAKGEKIGWENIVMTFTYSERTGKRWHDYLVISHYTPWNDEFEDKKIDIDNLSTTEGEVSSAIEYFKKRHNN